MNPIKVIIVDDHDLFRLGVRTAIEPHHSNIKIVGEAESGIAFFKLLETTEVDIVLLDVMLPDISGIEIARRLKNEHSEIKIIVISAEHSTSIIQAMLNIGINGFLSKLNSNPNTLVEALHAVLQGLDYFGKDISHIISRIYISKKKTMQVSSEFTEMEKTVIECCFEGLSAKMIADRLSISVRTVDWHKKNIFRKLGINSTLEMVQYAVQNGIIRAED